MGHYVGARAGEERLVSRGEMEKTEALAVIKCVEFHAIVRKEVNLLFGALPGSKRRPGDVFPGFQGRERGLTTLPEEKAGAFGDGIVLSLGLLPKKVIAGS